RLLAVVAAQQLIGDDTQYLRRLEALEDGPEGDGIGTVVRRSLQGGQGRTALFPAVEAVHDAPHPAGGVLVVPHALLVSDLVSPPLQACRLAEAGKRWLGSIERGPV